VIYLLTRPIAWLFKLLVTIVKSPAKAGIAVRDHRTRKRIKEAAKLAKQPVPGGPPA